MSTGPSSSELDPDVPPQVIQAMNALQESQDETAAASQTKASTASALATAQANDANANTALQTAQAAQSNALAGLQNILNQTYGTASGLSPLQR